MQPVLSAKVPKVSVGDILLVCKAAADFTSFSQSCLFFSFFLSLLGFGERVQKRAHSRAVCTLA